jgi:hypothetical protein
MTQVTREETAEFLSLPLIAHLITMHAGGSPERRARLVHVRKRTFLHFYTDPIPIRYKT